MHLPAEAGGGTEDLGAADDDDVEVCFGRGAEDRWLAAERSCMSSGLRLTLAAVFSLPPNHSSAVSVASHSTLVGGNMSSCRKRNCFQVPGFQSLVGLDENWFCAIWDI